MGGFGVEECLGQQGGVEVSYAHASPPARGREALPVLADPMEAARATAGVIRQEAASCVVEAGVGGEVGGEGVE